MKKKKVAPVKKIVSGTAAPKLSSEAAHYMSLSKEELGAKRQKAQDYLDSLSSLLKNPAVFVIENGDLLDPAALPEGLAGFLEVQEGELKTLGYGGMFMKLRHIVRMCNVAHEVITIREEQPLTQALLRVAEDMFPRKRLF